MPTRSRAGCVRASAVGAIVGGWLLGPAAACGQDRPVATPAGAAPGASAAGADGASLPINLPTALHLAGVRPIDVAVASERVRVATAQLDRANVLWLPTVFAGVDYARQDGRVQDIQGNVFPTGRSSLLVGAGPGVTFAVTDAVYAPLAARQVLAARRADAQAARNDTMLSVAEAYFNVQQARGEHAGAADAARRADDVARRAGQLATALAPAVEATRTRAEAARRRQSVEAAAERWQTASADLTRLLRLNPSSVVEPAEPPHTRVELVNVDAAVDDFIPVALVHRPELAARQAVVQATLARLKQEKVRPLVPSVLIRGNATNPGGTLSSGLFGGGVDGSVRNFGVRNSVDVQLVWEFQNLGFGNRATVRERQSEAQLALLEVFRTQDTVAAEVVQAHAQARRAAARVREAETGLKEAADLANTIVESMGQTRRVGETLVLVFRPQEVVAAVQSLAAASDDYYRAVGDANRAQFRLYRALGHPAEAVMQSQQPAPAPTPVSAVPPAVVPTPGRTPPDGPQ